MISRGRVDSVAHRAVMSHILFSIRGDFIQLTLVKFSFTGSAKTFTKYSAFPSEIAKFQTCKFKVHIHGTDQQACKFSIRMATYVFVARELNCLW